MTFLFFNVAGSILFERSDAESASVVHEEMSLQALFPYVADKSIERGMRVGYRDALDVFQVYEIRKVKTYEPDHYQELTAEHICISELTDEFFGDAEWTDISASEALGEILENTLWDVGNVSTTIISSANITMSNVWADVRTIERNWNCHIIPRVVVDSTGITARYLDITTADGTWRGMRLSLDKNADEMGVTWDDSRVKTALYAFGKSVEQTIDGEKVTKPITFTDVVWSETADHPAKPAGQAYLEDPAATAQYGRNGRPRFAYYQNGDISDPEILLQKTWESLQTLNHPDVTIDCTVSDLYRLGYNDTPLRLYDTALIDISQIGIRPYGTVLTRQIIQYTENLLDPTQSRVSIGTYIPNIIYISRETNKAAGGGSGGGGGQNDAEYTQGVFTSTLSYTEMGLSVTAAELQEAQSTIATQATQLVVTQRGITSLATGTGAQLNADGSLVVDAQGNPVFTGTGGGLYSKIEQNATAINLRVVKGDVATQLSVECGNVSVSGGNLVVDGYVTSAGLSSEIADLAEVQVNNINGTRAEFTTLDGTRVIGDEGEFAQLTIGNSDMANAVYSFGTPTASGGQISIPWTKVDGTAGTPINFNIADTAYYQSHVGIQTLALNGPISQPYQEGEYKGELTADRYYQAVATPKDGSAQKFFFKTPAGGTPLATQIDMQVRSASQSPPSAPSGTGSTMVFASTFSSLIDQYASQSGGPWYIPFDMTISGGQGTKRYYVKIN